MDKLTLSIDGYKCFDKKHEFYLNNITLLTGANSVGKSSVIQSLLIAKLLSESDVKNTKTEVSLMKNKFAMELGGYDDIINRQTITGNVEFFLSNFKFGILGEDNDNEKNKNVIFSMADEYKLEIKKVFSNGFVYLCADRMAPHYEYRESDSNEICDCHGSNVGDVFYQHQEDSIFPSRSIGFENNIKLLMQLDGWCNYIFPGLAVRVEKTGSQMYKMKMRNDVAPNVGFGITYALPILVSGLTIKEGGMLIVENPEAHLHAKAQSNIGYFLARMAAAGVRVIIETHSEHVVNGIRRMIVEGKTSMSHNDMTIYFFHNNEGKKSVQEIGMDDKGNLTEFPVDFFDQVRQDMLKLMELGRNHEN